MMKKGTVNLINVILYGDEIDNKGMFFEAQLSLFFLKVAIMK